MSPLVTGQGSDSPTVMFTTALLHRVESDAAHGPDKTDGRGGASGEWENVEVELNKDSFPSWNLTFSV